MIKPGEEIIAGNSQRLFSLNSARDSARVGLQTQYTGSTPAGTFFALSTRYGRYIYADFTQFG
jgi:hypothetical protein